MGKLSSLLLFSIITGLGFAIAETPGGILVQSIAKGGTADRDGRLQKGDRIIAVDDRSLAGVSYETVRQTKYFSLFFFYIRLLAYLLFVFMYLDSRLFR